MLEAFTHGITFLNCLSTVAFFTTVGLFLCGIPICRQIWKRKDTDEISGAPFLMGILGGCMWMAYGYLKKDDTVLIVTGCQVVLYSNYCVFYWIMSKQKFWITIKIVGLLSVCGALFCAVHFLGMKIFHPLGIVCMTLNTADFAAPLAGLRVVIRRGATSTLPLPLCIANFFVSTEWFIYGLLVHDFYLITPNGIGSVLAVCQLFLFVILPRKPGQKSLMARAVHKFRRSKNEELVDSKQDIIVELGSEDEKKQSTIVKRWSQMVKTNVSTVAEELENVIHMVGHDQFAYSHKIGSEDDSSSEKTLEREGETERKRGIPEQFLTRPMPKTQASVRVKGGENANKLRRTMSSPDLN